MGQKICSVDGCDRPSRSWGFCGMHFSRAYKHGDPLVRIRPAPGEITECGIPGCGRPHKARNYCSMHYQRFKRFGDPLFTEINPHGEGSIVPDGYRKITVNGRRILEHRYVMEQHIGRELTSSEVVHHIDGDPLNNRIENLEILTQNIHAKISPKAQEALKAGRKHRWPKLQQGT